MKCESIIHIIYKCTNIKVEFDYCQGIGFSDGSCPACSGEGRHTCPECNGSGVIRDEDEEDNEDFDDEF